MLTRQPEPAKSGVSVTYAGGRVSSLIVNGEPWPIED